MTAPGHGEPEWHLAEQVAQRVMSVYRETLGSPATLFQAAGLTIPPTMTAEEAMSAFPRQELSRLTRVAIQRLAAGQNLAAGRAPLRRCDWTVILCGLSSARTLRESVGRCSECFEAIDWRCGQMLLRIDSSSALLELNPRRPFEPSVASCLVDLFGVIEIHALLGWLIGRTLPIDPVMLNHTTDRYAALGLPALPFEVRVDRGWTGFGFDVAYLDYPVIRGVDELVARPRRSLLFVDNGAPSVASVSGKVRAIAYQSLRDIHRLPHFDAIVSVIGQSEATLRRRLALEGTSYRHIRESCRRELAFDLLRRTVLSIEEISARLDYCDSDAFRHAFRSWTGVSPSGFRQQSAA